MTHENYIDHAKAEVDEAAARIDLVHHLSDLLQIDGGYDPTDESTFIEIVMPGKTDDEYRKALAIVHTLIDSLNTFVKLEHTFREYQKDQLRAAAPGLGRILDILEGKEDQP